MNTSERKANRVLCWQSFWRGFFGLPLRSGGELLRRFYELEARYRGARR